MMVVCVNLSDKRKQYVFKCSENNFAVCYFFINFAEVTTHK